MVGVALMRDEQHQQVDEELVLDTNCKNWASCVWKRENDMQGSPGPVRVSIDVMLAPT
jgi:hypothetical protein